MAPDVLEAMSALGLLVQDPVEEHRCFCPVVLYPVRQLFVTSDRWKNPDGSLSVAFDDIVYPAITGNTQRFLGSLPDQPCEDLLELCAGTGAAALLAASSYARRVWAVDITERSTAFAEFNRRLNGLANLSVLTGDVYEPVGPMTFDRIVAHPPYMPSLKPGLIFYDGGQDGEQVTKRIVAGLPRHLRPSGRLYCLTLGADREGEPFEHRIRAWLGENEHDFDIAIIIRKIEEPGEFAARATLKSSGGMREVAQWKEFFRRQGVRHLVYASLIVQRKDSDRPVFTARRAIGPRSGCAEVEWLMRWESAAAAPATLEQLRTCRPVASPDLQLQVLHRMRNGELIPSAFTLLASYPFDMECQIPPWASFLVARSDGTATVQEHYDYCRQNRLIAAETSLAEFTRLVLVLISGGFLEIEGFRLPAATG